MYVDRDSTTMAEVEKARAPYDEYAQWHARDWIGCVAEFARHVRAKRPQPDVSMRIYRR